ncbi:translation machinery-associated protein 20 [Microbotryomycetes sp. JL201]|nr:translation machinery-associated protein 20 [Microbotryomycetes sp. JL201]
MFKKFTPKEDVASSTAMKSSIQRQHRAKLLEQLPFLSLPAAPPLVTDDNGPDVSDSDLSDDAASQPQRKKGAGKDKKAAKQAAKQQQAAGGGKKGGKRREDDEHADAQAQSAGTADAASTSEDALTVLDVLWPKKESLTLVKCREHISILALHGEPLFFQHFDGPYFPTLKVLHKYPGMLPKVGVDRGAIKFVLSGANIMCRGLTSPTAYLPPTESNIPSGQPVAVFAYGKEEPLAIGLTKMSSDEIRSVNKDIGVDNITFLGDDLWKVDRLA